MECRHDNHAQMHWIGEPTKDLSTPLLMNELLHLCRVTSDRSINTGQRCNGRGNSFSDSFPRLSTMVAFIINTQRGSLGFPTFLGDARMLSRQLVPHPSAEHVQTFGRRKTKIMEVLPESSIGCILGTQLQEPMPRLPNVREWITGGKSNLCMSTGLLPHLCEKVQHLLQKCECT